MADITEYLNAIMSAVFGRDVRSSIHDAIQTLNDTKVSAAPGKQLSSNDYTNADRDKLANISVNATKNTVITHRTSGIKIATLTTEWYDGDFESVDIYAPDGGSDIIVDDELDDESTNPVQNAVVTNSLLGLSAEIDELTDCAELVVMESGGETYLKLENFIPVSDHINERQHMLLKIPPEALDDGLLQYPIYWEYDTTYAVMISTLDYNGPFVKAGIYPCDIFKYDNLTYHLIFEEYGTSYGNANQLIRRDAQGKAWVGNLMDYDSPYTITNKKYVDEKISSVIGSNPNLIDNPWFTINQRGQALYTFDGSAVYCVDRWRAEPSGTGNQVSVASDGITITSNGDGYIAQYYDYSKIDDLLGKAFTLSVLLADGNECYNTSFTFPDEKPTTSSIVTVAWLTLPVGVSGTYATIQLSNSMMRVVLSRNIKKIKAVKLELGSVSTLLYDIPPDYITELKKCQRYFERINLNTGNIGKYIYSGMPGSNYLQTSFTFTYESKRKTPSINTSSGTFGIGYLNAGGNTAYNLAVDKTITPDISNCILTLEGEVDSEIRCLYAPPNSYIDINAEII